MGTRLNGKVALIIGAARGIGGDSRALREEGAKLVLADMEAEAGQATATALGADFIATDISRMEDARAAVQGR